MGGAARAAALSGKAAVRGAAGLRGASGWGGGALGPSPSCAGPACGAACGGWGAGAACARRALPRVAGAGRGGLLLPHARAAATWSRARALLPTHARPCRGCPLLQCCGGPPAGGGGPEGGPRCASACGGGLGQLLVRPGRAAQRRAASWAGADRCVCARRSTVEGGRGCGRPHPNPRHNITSNSQPSQPVQGDGRSGCSAAGRHAHGRAQLQHPGVQAAPGGAPGWARGPACMPCQGLACSACSAEGGARAPLPAPPRPPAACLPASPRRRSSSSSTSATTTRAPRRTSSPGSRPACWACCWEARRAAPSI